MQIMIDVKSKNYQSKPEQNLEENTRASLDSVANSGSILFHYICTVKQIKEIMQILA